MIAHIAANSPAADAGLKNGDVLLQVDGQKFDATKAVSLQKLKALFRQPVGTPLKIDVQLGESVIKTRIELRDLLP